TSRCRARRSDPTATLAMAKPRPIPKTLAFGLLHCNIDRGGSVRSSQEALTMDAANTSPDDHDATQALAPRGELSARHLAMPADTNPSGDIFGGWIMASMDAAASMTATRLAGGRTV